MAKDWSMVAVVCTVGFVRNDLLRDFCSYPLTKY